MITLMEARKLRLNLEQSVNAFVLGIEAEIRKQAPFADKCMFPMHCTWAVMNQVVEHLRDVCGFYVSVQVTQTPHPQNPDAAGMFMLMINWGALADQEGD